MMRLVAKAYANNRLSFIVKTDGTLWCAGYNPYGALGTGSTSTVYTFNRLNF